MDRDLLAALETGALVCDGAMGTMLMASGVESRCPEEINIVSPDTVLGLHAAYLAAGADVITTNSFGGSRTKMAKAGVADLLFQANLAAARIAREAARETALVAGSLGPLGEFLEPLGELTYEQAVAIYREQAEALAEGGVDFFLVETMFDLGEARAAVEGAASTGLPVACTMTFDTGLRTMMGVTPARAVAELRAAGAVAVGANCGVGPDETLKAIQEMHQADPSALLIAQPNAGVPSVEGGRTVYSVGAAEMADFVQQFLDSGVRLIGSCCGSSPEYTRAIVRVAKGG
ncbi:MAG: homocysteine S-methyltransferase family protein [Sphingomonadaceae bacterium]